MVHTGDYTCIQTTRVNRIVSITKWPRSWWAWTLFAIFLQAFPQTDWPTNFHILTCKHRHRGLFKFLCLLLLPTVGFSNMLCWENVSQIVIDCRVFFLVVLSFRRTRSYSSTFPSLLRSRKYNRWHYQACPITIAQASHQSGWSAWFWEDKYCRGNYSASLQGRGS